MPKLNNGDRIHIPASEVEIAVGGDTIWVHSPLGVTILRIKTTKEISFLQSDIAVCTTCDVLTDSQVIVSLAKNDCKVERPS